MGGRDARLVSSKPTDRLPPPATHPIFTSCHAMPCFQSIVPEAIRTAKEIGWVKAGDKVVVSNYEQWDDHSIKQSMNLRCLQVM